jgi:phosphate uptake regulator
MDSRKIQTSASGSFFVTLPKVWVSGSGLDKEGGRVELVTEPDGSIRLVPPTSRQKKMRDFTMHLEDFPDAVSLERYIKTCYVHGYDVINIASKKVITPEVKEIIKKAIVDLIGTEISEEYSNRITIRTLVDPLKFPMEMLMQRIHTLVSSMHNDAMESFMKGDTELAGSVVRREEEVEKLYGLALRQLFLAIENRNICEGICTRNVWDCVIGAIVARDLSRMAFYAADIAKQALELGNKKVSEDVKRQLRKMSELGAEMNENAMRAFFKDDFMMANRVANMLDEVRELDRATGMKILESRVEPIAAMILTTVSRDLRRIASYAAAVAYDTQEKHIPMRKEEKVIEPAQLIRALGYK